MSLAGMRVSRHWFEDGLPELANGVSHIVTAILIVALGARWPGLSAWMWFAVWMAVTLLVFATVPRFKKRLTHPRSGYAEPRAWTGPPGRWIVALVLAFIVVQVGVTVAARVAGVELDRFLFQLGGVFGFVGFYAALSARMPRFAVFGLLAFAWGVSTAAAGGGPAWIAAFFAGVGAVHLISGGLALRRFLERVASPESVDV